MTLPPSTLQVLEALWVGAGLPAETLRDAQISLPNADKHVLKSSYRIGVAAQACIAATGLAASLLRHLTAGDPVEVQVEARHAALEFASERYSSELYSSGCQQCQVQKFTSKVTRITPRRAVQR